MELHIQKYLRTHGLEKTIEQFKLIHKVKGNLNLFKYNQIESDYSLPEVQEARGLILDSSNNWNVVCYTFHKFFNTQEGFAHPLDWSSTKIFRKLDGSIIQLYFYMNEWHVATSGTIDAQTDSNDGLITFHDLFWKTVKIQYNLTKEEFGAKFDHDYCYAFELCTPFNIVVTQHKDHQIHLLGLRNKITLLEETIEQEKFDWLLRPDTFNILDINAVHDLLTDWDWQMEGVIALDKHFNRQKVKNPKYVAVHHLKGSLGAHHIMQVIKDNELSEFCVYFKERQDEAFELKRKYDLLCKYIDDLYLITLNGGEGFESQKDYALAVQTKIDRTYQGLMYGLKKGSYKNAVEWLYKEDNRWLYLYLNNQFLQLNLKDVA